MTIDVERVVLLTKQGWSLKQIAEELGCSTSGVTRVRWRTGITHLYLGPTFLSAEEYAQAEGLLADGCSLAEVARTLGRCERTITAHFKGRGWTRQECLAFAKMHRNPKPVIING